MVEDGNVIVMKSIFVFMSNREGDFGLSFWFVLRGSSFVSPPTWGFKG